MPRKAINTEAADDFDVPGTAAQEANPATSSEEDAQPQARPPATSSQEQCHSEYEVLPVSLRDAFALLQQAEAQPTATKADEHIKAGRLTRIKKHIFGLQQMPVATLDSENMHRAFKHQDAKAKAERLKVLAREHPEVAALLAENKQLREQLEKPKK